MPCVLFVDDDPMMRRTLQRGMRMQRPRWEMCFAAGGDEALVALAARPIDVIVSDVTMPDMDGLRLLGEVRARFPRVSRVVFSGNALADGDSRALVVPHRWLSKPCGGAAIYEMIERLLWARTLVADDALLACVLGERSLPSPPAVFAQLRRAIERQASVRELAEIVGTDPAIAAKVLQLASSAVFGACDCGTSIERAIAVLGSDLRTVVFATELFRAGTAPPGVIEHSQRVARVAAQIDPTRGAAIAGLLHEVGQLVTDAPALDRLGYARLGGLLLGSWGLPREIAVAVAYHHDPEAAPEPAEPTLVTLALADALVEELESGEQSTHVDARAALHGIEPRLCRERAALEIGR